MIVFVVGTALILALLAWGTYRTAQLLDQLPLTINLLLLPSENGLRLALIGLCLGLGWASGLSFERLGWGAIDLLRNLVLGVLVGAVVAAIVPPFTHGVVKLFGPSVYSPTVVKRVIPRSAREWVLVPLAMLPAVFLEELLFRSLLLGGFSVFVSPLALGVVWSLFFGALHIPQGAFGMGVAAGMGLLLSALFVASGSLVAPVAAHYAINMLQLIWASHDKTWLDGVYSARHSV